MASFNKRNLFTMKDKLDIQSMAYELKLPYIKQFYQEELKEAAELNKNHYDFLLELLEKEIETRKENSIKNKLKNAKFPYKKYLVDLDRDALPKDSRKKLQYLETLEFLKNGENIILIGNPGVGKTHIAIGLGVKACMAGKTVLFASVPTLITELKEKVSLNQLSAFRKRFQRYDLVILDELGYISFDKQGGELLFNLLTSRNEEKSTLITSNLPFEKWSDIFNDSILTTAMIDRLSHKAHILNMMGDSYRLKETMDWMAGSTN